MRNQTRFSACIVTALLAPACMGTVGNQAGGGGSDNGGGPNGTGDVGSNTNTNNNGSGGTHVTGNTSTTGNDASFACNANSKSAPEKLRRLTAIQHHNTIADLAAFALGNDSATATQVMTSLTTALAEMPADERISVPQDLHGTYRRLDQSVQQNYVQAAYDIGTALGASLTTSANLGKVVGTCATDNVATNDATCVSDFIKRFGARALRRPLTTDEVTFYQTVYASTGIDAAGFADVIATMVGAPQFLYTVENGSTAVASTTGVYALSAFELASRLSYQFWDTMPDDALWQDAQSGTLLSDDKTYAAEVDRLLASPRARAGVKNFFNEWFKLEDVKGLDGLNGDARFKAFAASDMPSSTLNLSMANDVVNMSSYYTWTSKGSLHDMLTSSLSFADTADLAQIYGVSTWNGTGTPPSLGNRTGLLTRAAFLQNASGNTRPIMKGVFIRESILCDTIGAPPAGANANPPMLSTDLTTRQVVEGLTETKGTVCAACHPTMINGLGFATEGYDALGRARSAQKLFDATGTLVRSLPVDTQSIPQVVVGDKTASSGPADLARLIVASGKADACMARQYYRYSFARWEDDDTDGCTLESLRSALTGDTGTVIGLLRAVAFTPQFKQRTFN